MSIFTRSYSMFIRIICTHKLNCDFEYIKQSKFELSFTF